MSNDQPPAALIAAAKAHPKKVSEDQLQKLREAVAKVRDLEIRKVNAEEALKEINVELNNQYFKELPDLLDQADVPEITIGASGNMPAYTATASPYYHGSISAEWEPEKQAKAFDWLTDNGHGDLIKTQVTVSFPREQRAAAVKFAAQLEKAGMNVDVGQGVHWKTLTAWLKEMVEKHQTVPPLETLGCTVGRVVKLKPKKD